MLLCTCKLSQESHFPCLVYHIERFTLSQAIDTCLCTDWSHEVTTSGFWSLITLAGYHKVWTLSLDNYNISYRWHFGPFTGVHTVSSEQHKELQQGSRAKIAAFTTGELGWNHLIFTSFLSALCLKMDWCTNALRVIWVFCWNSSQSNMTCHRLFVVDCDFIIVWHAIWSKPSTLAGVCHTWSDIFNHKWSPDHSWFWCSWKQGIHKADRATHKSWEVHIMEWLCSMFTTTPKATFYANTARKSKDWSVRVCIMAGISSWLLPADANRLVHSPHYITVEEADELSVVVMGTENDLLVMLTSLRPSSATKTYSIMKYCRNLEIV